MVIPTTETAVLLLSLLALLSWGSWPNAIKAGNKWRFELFYYDFSLGALLAAIVAAFTLGTLGADITMMDNLSIVRRLQIAYALGAGAVFNLGNLLLAGAASLAGLSVTFSIGASVAILVAALVQYNVAPQSKPLLVAVGAAILVIAIVTASLAYHRQLKLRAREIAHAAEVVGRKAPLVKKTALKGVLISLFGGILVGFTPELARNARVGDLEMGPYPILLLFAVAMFFTTLLYNLYFLNLPIQGDAISMFAWFRGTARQHGVGLIAGTVWCAGTTAALALAAVPADVRANTASASYGLTNSAGALSVLCGLAYWKEYGAVVGSKTRIMLWTVLGAVVAGVALLAVGHGPPPR